MSAIIDYCVVEMGKNRGASMTTADMKAEVNAWPAENHPAGARMTDRAHLALCIGMKTLNVAHGNLDAIALNSITLSRAIAAMAAIHGASPFVRVRSDLFWNAVKGQMPYRNFSVLAAVYAVIGAQPWPVRITRDRINAAALGYKSQKLVTPELLAQRQDGAALLTTDQLRYTLDRLEGDALFIRVQLSPRRVYFSNRMTREAMTEALFKTATKRHTRLTANRAADRELQARIRAPIIVGKVSQKTPRIPHAIPMKSPPSPHEIPTLVETPLKETPLKETQNIPVPPAGERAVLVQESMPTERDRLQRLIDQATAIGTPEALRQADGYKQTMERL